MAIFELRLEEHLFSLHERLLRGAWVHDQYGETRIADPKPRIIHIASVRDRVLYQAVYQQLYQVFDKTFIHDSYASRGEKGTHAGVERFEVFVRKVSANHTTRAFVLKCDIRKFFDGIDHGLLFSLISKRIVEERLLILIYQIISSFEVVSGRGLPLGNVTSQLFANIYLNELDQFIKHTLKVKYYIRYCDDFVILDARHSVLEATTTAVRDFLRHKLSLELHPQKVEIRKISQGTDFLGYVSLPHYRILRTRTKRRMFKRLNTLAKSINSTEEFESVLPVVSSYLGALSHCRSGKLRKVIEQWFEKWR